jgi:hypothetical protein
MAFKMDFDECPLNDVAVHVEKHDRVFSGSIVKSPFGDRLAATPDAKNGRWSCVPFSPRPGGDAPAEEGRREITASRRVYFLL